MAELVKWALHRVWNADGARKQSPQALLMSCYYDHWLSPKAQGLQSGHSHPSPAIQRHCLEPRGNPKNYCPKGCSKEPASPTHSAGPHGEGPHRVALRPSVSQSKGLLECCPQLCVCSLKEQKSTPKIK